MHSHQIKSSKADPPWESPKQWKLRNCNVHEQTFCLGVSPDSDMFPFDLPTPNIKKIEIINPTRTATSRVAFHAPRGCGWPATRVVLGSNLQIDAWKVEKYWKVPASSARLNIWSVQVVEILLWDSAGCARASPARCSSLYMETTKRAQEFPKGSAQSCCILATDSGGSPQSCRHPPTLHDPSWFRIQHNKISMAGSLLARVLLKVWDGRTLP